MAAVVTKSGNLNFLEHSGPLQACIYIQISVPTAQETQFELLYSVLLVQTTFEDGTYSLSRNVGT